MTSPWHRFLVFGFWSIHVGISLSRSPGVLPWSAERDCRKCGDRQHLNHRHRGNVNSPIYGLHTRRIGNDKLFICLLEPNAGSSSSFSSHQHRRVTYIILLTSLLPAWRSQHLSSNRELRDPQRWSFTNQAKQTTVCLEIHSKLERSPPILTRLPCSNQKHPSKRHAWSHAP
jgi:hypothetical protein